MEINRQVARGLLSIGAVFLRPQEPFTWASGIKSPIYCDNRLILTAPEVRVLVENAIAATVKREYPDAEVLMGTATAGIAHAAIAAHLLGLPMGYVRSGNKDHGRKNRIEGRLDRKSIGFDAVIEGRKEKDHAKILREVQPHDILKFGIIPELVGRLPVIAALDELRRDDLVRILTEPKNALVKQYQKLLSYDGAELVFDHDALEEIADKAIERKIGARGLRAVMEGLLTKVMYDIPSDRTIDRVTITRDCVDGKEPPQLGHRKEALQEGKPAAELPPVEPAS